MEVFEEEVLDKEKLFKTLTLESENTIFHLKSIQSYIPIYSTHKRDKVMSLEEGINLRKTTDFMKEKRNITSFSDLQNLISSINFYFGEKYIESRDCEDSDDIYNSLSIYRSNNVFDSKEIAYSKHIYNSAYLYFSINTSDSSFCIKVKDSKTLSNCFDVDWSAKCSDCICCYDCYDIRDCMFCFHIQSKRFCIGNMQFEKEEYYKIKVLLIKEILDKYG